MSFSRTCPGAAAAVMGVVLTAFAPGCGRGGPEFDKAALYTPESLAQELAFRYRGLKPEARKSTRRAGGGSRSEKRLAALERARQAEKKGGDTVATKKRTGPPTLDDLLDDVDRKVDLLKGISRKDACRQMGETITKDTSLDENDKKLLAEKLKELGDPSS